MGIVRHLMLAAALGVGVPSEMALAQTRRIDSYSGIVVNCGPGSDVQWANRVCQTMIGEMHKRAAEAKVKLIAVPQFADDATLDRRASEEGLDLFRVLHIRLVISPQSASSQAGQNLRLLLRSLHTGPVSSFTKDGPYNILAYTPMATLVGPPSASKAASAVTQLTENVFLLMLQPPR